MIYEFRTYSLRPGTLPEFLQLFGEALPGREQFSKLAAFWHTEVGRLNEVVHVWPYEDAQERRRIRAEAVKAGVWPPATGKLIVDMKAEVFDLLPFSPPLEPSQNGPWFEMRTCLLKPFTLPTMIEQWSHALSDRTGLSSLIGVFASDVGELNRWTHIWAYRSLEERAAVCQAAAGVGLWSAPSDGPVVAEESKILLPASFSSIR